MIDAVKSVEYYYTIVADRPGESRKLMAGKKKPRKSGGGKYLSRQIF